METLRLPDLLRNFLILWNEETYILLRIRFIMVLLLLLYMMMFVLVTFSRRRFRNIIGRLKLLDAVCDSILAYILGAMQAAPFKNKLFPVWALVLVNFRASVNSLSGYGTYTELRIILKLLAVAYMNITQGSKTWRIPFWVFWSFLVLRSINRIYARRMISKSLWLGRSSELLQDYMGSSNLAPDGCDPTTMEGYRYLVYGESKQSNGGTTGPSLGIDDGSSSLVTLDMIWRCPQLRWIRAGGMLKEQCLAFALSRLLRCRLEGAPLHVASVNMTRKLICSRIIPSDDGAERTLFRILKLDLMFLNDYLHTSYPSIFSEGLRSLAFTFLQSVVRYGMALWLAVDIRHVYRPVSVRVPFNVDVIITWVAMFYVLFMDVWDIVRYSLSNWAKVLYLCKYVSSSQTVLLMRPLVSRAMASIVSSRIESGDDAVMMTMGQYVLLQSFNGTTRPKFVNAPLSAEFQVLQALSSLRDMDQEANSLPRYFTPLRSQYWLACLQLPTCSDVILVLHIATSICEMRLAQDRGMDLLWNPGFLSTAILLPLTRLFCSSQNFLVDDERFLDGDLRTNYVVANSLSRYCTYLLVSKPDLLPDAVLVTKKVFRETHWHAREMLKQCDSLQSIYSKLISPLREDVEPAGGQGSISLTGNTVEQGVQLGKRMVHSEHEEHRWRLLAEVWVNLLVHIAPSTNAEAHAKHLESGDEFLTVIWALLCHCGIEKSELWHPEKAASSTSNRVDSTGVHQQTVSPGAPASST